jgi:nicotinamidase-related amidase
VSTHGQDTDAFYAERGFGKAAGFGRRPVLVIVDLQNGFTDPASPLGGDYTELVAENKRLVDICHDKGVPVVFTTVYYDEAPAQPAAVFQAKVPSLLVLKAGSAWAEIDERLGMTDKDTLVVKQFASAFWGTNLGALMASWQADTCIVTGVTTSGCVRATAVDALQHGYRVIVPRECSGDRAPGPHEANLFDINQKYGDVLPNDDVVAYLASLPAQTPAL